MPNSNDEAICNILNEVHRRMVAAELDMKRVEVDMLYQCQVQIWYHTEIKPLIKAAKILGWKSGYGALN